MEAIQNSTSAIFTAQGYQLIEPIMHGFTSLLLLGSIALQGVFGRPDPARARRDGALLQRAVNDFIATEEQVALQKLLCSIGSGGCNAQGVAAGLVIASPSKSDPDCK